MKTAKILLILFTFCLSSITLMAAPVSNSTARTVAANFWNSHHPGDVKPVAEADMVAMSYEGISHLHVFAVGQEGFVIVAGDDRAKPVLAYSFDSPFPKTLHATLRYWLGSYEGQLANLESSDADAPAETAAAWQALLSPTKDGDPQPIVEVSALVTTRWDQDSPYNNYCPYDTNYHARTVVGCVATAMAQIIRFWKYPSCGIGEHSYVPESREIDIETDSGTQHLVYHYDTQRADFAHTTYIYDFMPAFVENHFSADYQINAVAKLSYHCGVAVNMQYGPSRTGGSGAYSEDAASAFVNVFKYKAPLERTFRNGISDSAWRARIDENLVAGRPVYYTGRDNSGGHAFILDGADLEGRYHFNMGWAGSGDGFYDVSDISIGSGGAGGNATYSFNQSQSAIFGIEPIDTQLDTVDFYDTICPDLTTYVFYDYSITARNGVYDFIHLDTVYRVHLTKAPRRYIYLNPNGAAGSTTSGWFCYLNGAVIPECSFTYEGYNFVGWCPSAYGEDTVYNPGDTVWTRRNLVLYAMWQDTAHMGITDAQLSTLNTQLYPNPTTGELHVTVGSSQQAELSVLDVMGRTVLRDTLCGKAKISLQDLPAGMYIVHIRTADGVCNQRVIKQ